MLGLGYVIIGGGMQQIETCYSVWETKPKTPQWGQGDLDAPWQALNAPACRQKNQKNNPERA